jgi:hypothetical protein
MLFAAQRDLYETENANKITLLRNILKVANGFIPSYRIAEIASGELKPFKIPH